MNATLPEQNSGQNQEQTHGQTPEQIGQQVCAIVANSSSWTTSSTC